MSWNARKRCKKMTFRLQTQFQQEQSFQGQRSVEWVELLPAVLKAMNSDVTRLTGKAPEKYIQASEVGVKAPYYNRPVSFTEERLLFGNLKVVKSVVLQILCGA